jgi:hypothetical protein
MRLRLSPGRWCAVGVAAAIPLAALAQTPASIDGRDIPNDFINAPTVAVQRYQTQFGDNAGFTFNFGSELDRMFVMNDNDNLYVGITGNLENNGNCIVVFLDADGSATGANTLVTRNAAGPIPGFPRYLAGNPSGPNGLDGWKFDAGFFPDWALGWSGGSPLGSQTRSYYLVNFTDLPEPNDPNTGANTLSGLMTDNDPTASGSAGTLGPFLGSDAMGILAASDNDNGLGVDGGTFPVDDPNIMADPNTAMIGFEAAIPLSLLGVGDQDQVCVYALVSSPDGFASNQMLPPPATEATFGNLGNGPHDLTTISGDQFICHTIALEDVCGPECGGANLDGLDGEGNCDVDLDDLTILLQNFMGTNVPSPGGDTDNDGDTDLDDLTILLQKFGTQCPPAP